jgi:autotransporter-associated beta strand protein
VTIADTIGDQSGSGDSGLGSLLIDGAGTVVLSDANTFAGGATLKSGTLDVGNAASSAPRAPTICRLTIPCSLRAHARFGLVATRACRPRSLAMDERRGDAAVPPDADVLELRLAGAARYPMADIAEPATAPAIAAVSRRRALNGPIPMRRPR